MQSIEKFKGEAIRYQSLAAEATTKRVRDHLQSLARQKGRIAEEVAKALSPTDE
jgi:hypothetical protein